MARQLPLSDANVTDSDVRPESATHQVAHNAASFFRPWVVIFIAATIVLMATIWPAAIVTGFIAVACGFIVWIADRVEDHSESGRPPIPRGATPDAEAALLAAEAQAEEETADEPVIPGGSISTRVISHESRTIAGIAGAFVVLALILGFALFDWRTMALGTAILFMYMAIVSFPMWAAWIEGEVEEETARAEAEGAEPRLDA